MDTCNLKQPDLYDTSSNKNVINIEIFNFSNMINFVSSSSLFQYIQSFPEMEMKTLPSDLLLLCECLEELSGLHVVQLQVGVASRVLLGY